jgi:acyl-CoA hydrolase
MSDWKQHLKERTVTLEEAAKKIESGDVIWPGQTIAVPYGLMEAIADRADELHDVLFYTNMFLKPIRLLTDPALKKSFKLLSIFPNALERASAKLGIMDFAPIPYSYSPKAMREVYKVNTCCFEMCPPDEEGYCNVSALGCGTSATVAGFADKVIAVFNKHHVPVKGPAEVTKLHVSNIDWFVYDDHELPSIPPSAPEPIDEQIAKIIVEQIHDGDTFQVGMGGLPNAILASLKDKKDLKVYTEILTDGMVDLAEAGVITSMKAVGAFGMPRLYEFFSNPMVTFGNNHQILDPTNIAKVENLISINATLQVDLTGQCCSEAIGPMQYSSVGGQLDFIRGACMAKGGRSYITLRSTRTGKDGKLYSNIVACLPEGSIVTTPRAEPMFIVTEYGIADIYMKPIKDRIKALIAIAHPDFRDELKAKAIAQGNIFPDDF